MAAAAPGTAAASRLFLPNLRPNHRPSSLLPCPSLKIPTSLYRTLSATHFRPLPPKSATSDALPLVPSDDLPPSSSRPMTLKSRLSAGETLYGIFLLASSPTLAEIAGLAGYDFAVIDMEHGPGGITEALEAIRALAAARTPAILRVPELSAWWAKKALDLGPQGIMFPAVESPAAARDAVSFCRFPPAGIRGSAHPVVRASAYGIDDGYLENYESELLVMVQVETAEGVSQVGEIAAVEGVDCVQTGPLDLSASLGYLWDPGNRKVKEALRTAERGVLASGTTYLSGFAMPHDPPERLKERGYHMVSGAVDVGLFRAAAVEDVRRFKAAKAAALEEEEEDWEGQEKYWSE